MLEAYLVSFVGGLAGSAHCVGMCGAFPLALASGPGAARRQALYHLGRLGSLTFIGAACGLAGALLIATGPVLVVERGLAVVAGLVLIGVGLELLGLARVVPERLADLARRTVGRALRLVIRSRSRAAPLALGVFNAFLPCHLVYAFAAQAAHVASPGAGALTMLAFGAGTVPLMVALGAAGRWAPGIARHTTRPAGAVMLVFGVVMLLRASGWLHGQGHHG